MANTEPVGLQSEPSELDELKDHLEALSTDQPPAEPRIPASQVTAFIDRNFGEVQQAEGMLDHDCETILELVRSCDDPLLPQAIRHLMRLYNEQPLIQDDEEVPFPQALIRALAENQHGQLALLEVCRYMADHEREYTYRFNRSSEDEYQIDDFMQDIRLGSVEEIQPIVEALLSSSDLEMQQKVLRMLVDSVGFAHIINSVRDYVNGAQGKPHAAHAEAIGKWLLGIKGSDIPFHTSLNAFYANMDFEQFPLNVESQGRDIERLREELLRVEGIQGTIIDMGCGTGRLANALAAEGVRDIVGIDSSPVNLAKAQIADASGSVDYKEADWTSTDLPDDSAKMVFVLGRTLPHAEDDATLQRVFSEARRVLVEGGVLFFDIPDPDTGMYLEARKRHLTNLRAMGTPISGTDDEVLPMISTVVSSPDGTNYMNRFMPPLDLVQLQLHFKDFDVEEVGRYRLKAGDEAECAYFRATKKPEASIDELVARLNSREPSS